MTFLRRTLIFFIYAMAALCVFAFWFHRGIATEKARALPQLISGEAPRPYVRQQLVPTVVRATLTIMGPTGRERLRAVAEEQQGIAAFFERHNLPKQHFPDYLVTMVIAYGCFLGFAYALRLLVNALYQGSARASDIYPFFALLWLPTTFREATIFCPADPATLLLVTLGIVFMTQQRWALLYLIYPLGCLNHYNFIFIAFLFGLVYARKMPGRRLVGHLAAQLVIYLAVLSALHFAFRNNPGGVLEFHALGYNRWWLHNLLGRPYEIPLVITVLIVLGAVFHDWPVKPKLLTIAMWLVPLLLPIFLLFTWVDELRGYYPFFPVITLLMFHSFGKCILQLPMEARDPSRPIAPP